MPIACPADSVPVACPAASVPVGCPADSVPVARMKAAGAVVFGKTNVPVGCLDWQAYNPVYGVTQNPWRADASPGGSSPWALAGFVSGSLFFSSAATFPCR